MYLSQIFMLQLFFFLSFVSYFNTDSKQEHDQFLNISPDVDREYILESTMLGYTGIGGMIDGVLNPDPSSPKW